MQQTRPKGLSISVQSFLTAMIVIFSLMVASYLLTLVIPGGAYSRIADGFSNVFYPTNPALLISLGLADVSYADWFRWSAKFQILNLILTGAILIIGLSVGY